MKEHTRLLLEKSQSAIRAAEILQDAEEIDFAAGRLYYAMLYVAEALLHERNLVFRKHSAVHAAYGAGSEPAAGAACRVIPRELERRC